LERPSLPVLLTEQAKAIRAASLDVTPDVYIAASADIASGLDIASRLDRVACVNAPCPRWFVLATDNQAWA
jgi:hypothetical protein